MRHLGGHVSGQEPKPFSRLGTKLYCHVNSLRILSPNMAALLHGCKPRIVLKRIQSVTVCTNTLS